MVWTATLVRMEWRCSKKASSARPSRASVRAATGTSQRRSAPVRSAQAGMLTRSVGWQSRAASRRLRMRPWEKASWGSGGKWRSMMAATSRRCSRGAMRAKGPKRRVSSVRVGPCQASAIGASAGTRVAGNARRLAQRGKEIIGGRSTASLRRKKTREAPMTVRTQRRIVRGGRSHLPPSPEIGGPSENRVRKMGLGLLTTSPIEMDLTLWDDYDGEIAPLIKNYLKGVLETDMAGKYSQPVKD